MIIPQHVMTVVQTALSKMEFVALVILGLYLPLGEYIMLEGD